MLVCLQGYVASRHVTYGSQYIRCLVYVFSRKAHVDHVVDMLTEVGGTFLIQHLTDFYDYCSYADVKRMIWVTVKQFIFMPSPV